MNWESLIVIILIAIAIIIIPLSWVWKLVGIAALVILGTIAVGILLGRSSPNTNAM